LLSGPVAPSESQGNFASRIRLIVTRCAWLVRSIGFFVHARHCSQPNRCFVAEPVLLAEARREKPDHL